MPVTCRVAPLLPEIGSVVRRLIELDDSYFGTDGKMSQAGYAAGMAKADQKLKAIETVIMTTPATSTAGLATQLAIAIADAGTLHAWASDEEAATPYFYRLSAALRSLLDASDLSEADTDVIEFYAGRKVQKPSPETDAPSAVVRKPPRSAGKRSGIGPAAH